MMLMQPESHVYISWNIVLNVLYIPDFRVRFSLFDSSLIVFDSCTILIPTCISTTGYLRYVFSPDIC